MSETADRTPSEAGWTQLSREEWSQARESFRRMVALDGSVQAYEGLSWAAWWMDNADEVFESRRRAFPLYTQQDNSSAAARMATWLAADEADFRGATAVAPG